MNRMIACGLAAGALALAVNAGAEPARGLSIAVIPTQYFAADAQSAQRITDGLVGRFEGQGYRVLSPRDAERTFGEMKLQPRRHYADEVAVRFGRRMGADLVAYPRLLALGPPAAVPGGAVFDPAAVVLLRVINVRTGKAIYGRQIAHEFQSTPTPRGQFHLPVQSAQATATEVTQNYFERVAGSHDETP